MKKFRLIIIVCTLCIMGACNGRPGDGREGGTDKREWSILQGYEAKSRATGINNIEFHKSDEYNVICLPSEGTGKRIWIMMDAKSPPFYKQMPDGNYLLTEGQFSEILRRTNPTSTVLEAMRSHVRKSPSCYASTD